MGVVTAWCSRFEISGSIWFNVVEECAKISKSTDFGPINHQSIFFCIPAYVYPDKKIELWRPRHEHSFLVSKL